VPEPGVEINREVANNLEGINGEVGLVGQVMIEIAESSERQQKGIAALTLSMNQLEKMTQPYVSNSNQSIFSSEALSGQAEAIQRLVVTFQLSDSRTENGVVAPVDSGHAQSEAELNQAAIRWET
jgi:methyl-accepting chemotaxis protein